MSKDNTLEKLARITHEEFDRVRQGMATKRDLRELELKIVRGFEETTKTLRKIQESLNTLIQEKDMVRVEITALEKRVARLERRAGIAK